MADHEFFSMPLNYIDHILNEAKEMADSIRKKQWMEDYHKNNVAFPQMYQNKLKEKRMLDVKVDLQSIILMLWSYKYAENNSFI